MTLEQLDVVALRRWVVTARADLAAHARALDRLNVFPVPDGDTGTNLLATMDTALHTLAEQAPTRLVPAAQGLAEATLAAARGNSGVILSQLVAGVAQVVTELGQDALDGPQLQRVLLRAAQLARRGVARPQEGTVLTVASAAADGAEHAVAAGRRALVQVVDGAVDAASDALVATRTQLDVLARAGVVDAGGAGYLIVLQALQRVVHGGSVLRTVEPAPAWLHPVEPVVCAEPDRAAPAGPAYEVMFLLDQHDDAAVARMRDRLVGLGDSVIVAGGPDRWSVHAHVDDIAAALNAGADAGRPHEFRITRFADHPSVAVTGHDAASRPVRMLVITPSDELAGVARGEDALVPRAAGAALPTEQECLAVVPRLGRDVAILPDRPQVADLAGRVASRLRDTGVGARVCAVRHPAQVLAVLAVCGGMPSSGLDEVIGQIDEVVTETRTATVDLHGIAAAAADLSSVVGQAVTAGSELVTVVFGDDTEPSARSALLAAIGRAAPHAQTTVVQHGGPGTTCWIGAEG